MDTGRFRHLALGDVGSTNDEVRARIDQLDGGPLVITAERQMKGRGRRGREWVSPAGNLYASFAFCPNVPLVRFAELSFAVAVAVAEMAEALVGTRATIRCKWPNDVLADGAKLSGILLETARTGAGRDAVIMGIGINVASAPVDTPYAAAALGSIDPDVAVDRVLAMLSLRLTAWTQTWETQGFAHVRAAWLAIADGLGAPIVARLADGELHGRFDGLDDDGALLLRQVDDTIRRVTAGDVFRPASR
ncbi:MAG: biotin--[acetyl-CoA-carboxylase] ligase [Minwuia sp.]|nr:biotin--[acetyl-CoA-carboxylase] ligase [Minwuia sp.]